MSTTYDPKLDHLVLATPDLAGTVKAMASVLGVTPTPGGKHAGLGTENVLVALGARQYLEIIGPDVAAPAPPMPRPFDIDTLLGPKLVAWAISETDLDACLKRARARGYDPGVVIPMSRQAGNGSSLQWRLAVPPPTPQGFPLPCEGVVPFVIEWGKTPHPARTSVPGCRLLEFRGVHPDPAGIAEKLAALDVDLTVSEGSPALVAVVSTPSGVVELR